MMDTAVNEKDHINTTKNVKLEVLDRLSDTFLVVVFINLFVFMFSVFVILSLSEDTISESNGYIHGNGYIPNWLQILALCSLVTTVFSFLNMLIVSLVKEKVSYENNSPASNA